MDHEPYRYEPLYKTTPSIRLVTILPPNEDGELCLDLEVMSLATAADDYAAVSYAWGPGPAEHRVWIEDKLLLLRSSIWRFLQHCCKTEVHGKAKLWIDSICIDQDNVLEKNTQVQFMKDIFQNAEKVLVWLSEASESGIDKVMSQCCHEEYPRWTWTNKGRCQLFVSFLEKSYLQSTIPSKDALAEAAYTIRNCQYWTRLWIVQEFVLAQRLLFVLGACTFTAAYIDGVNVWRLDTYEGTRSLSKGNTPARLKDYKRNELVSELFLLRLQKEPSQGAPRRPDQ